MPLTFSWLSRLAALHLHVDAAGAVTPRGWVGVTLQLGPAKLSLDLLSRETRAEEARLLPRRAARVGPMRVTASMGAGGPTIVNRVLLDLLSMRPDTPVDGEQVLRRQAPWLVLDPGGTVRAPWWWPADVAEAVRRRVASELGRPRGG